MDLDAIQIERGDRDWEREQADLARAGDRGAADRLFRSHAKMIWQISAKFAKGSGWDVDEAFAAASLVFMERLQSSPRIGAASPPSSTSRSRSGCGSSATATTRSLKTDYNGEVHKQHEKVLRTKRISRLYRQEDDAPIAINDSGAVDPSVLAAERERAEVVQAALREVHPTYREVIERTLLEHQTLEDVGAALGVSRERVRQLQAKGLASLRLRVDRLLERRSGAARPRIPIHSSPPTKARTSPIMELLEALDSVTPHELAAELKKLDDLFAQTKAAYLAKRKKLIALGKAIGGPPQRAAAKRRSPSQQTAVGTDEDGLPEEGTFARRLWDALGKIGEGTAAEVAKKMKSVAGPVAAGLRRYPQFFVEDEGVWSLREDG